MIAIAIHLPNQEAIATACRGIMEARAQTGFLGSFLLAIPCGMLMYMAVSSPDNPMRLFYVSMCVMAFICGGFYHCVADMFYTLAGAMTWQQYVNIFFVTAGNFVGCNIIPLAQKYHDPKGHHENSVATPSTHLHQDAIYNLDKPELHQGAPR